MAVWITIIGILLIVGIALFIWAPKKGGTQAEISPSGYQEQTILVKGGYAPDTIIVQVGKPVRLQFVREDKSSCSEMVLFSDFRKSVMLPYGERTLVELLPTKAGTYPFACQMGMYKGTLIVKD